MCIWLLIHEIDREQTTSEHKKRNTCAYISGYTLSWVAEISEATLDVSYIW